jgi:hypothetical protein
MPSKLLSDLIVFSADLVLAIKPFKPADREMTTGHFLEVFDERIVYRRTAESTDDREGLRGHLLRNHQSEARCDLGDELQEDGRSFPDDAAFGNEPGGFADRVAASDAYRVFYGADGRFASWTCA